MVWADVETLAKSLESFDRRVCKIVFNMTGEFSGVYGNAPIEKGEEFCIVTNDGVTHPFG